MKERIQILADEMSATLSNLRRSLHSIAELSFQEIKTSAFVRSKLRELGIDAEPLAGTGLVGIISGEKGPGKVIALRADMDALPITEENILNHRSVHDGVMHACGHDAHMASLLGAAGILMKLKSEFAGTIKLIFQPGEEKLPGGASMMIAEGVLEIPRPVSIIGQHVCPSLKTGKIAVRGGKFMASMDEIFVKVTGKGGHAAQPHLNIDPVVIASQIILAMQQVVSRMSDPSSPSVLSFGKVLANGSINVIPDEVYMEGTFRAMNEQWRVKAHDQIKKIAQSIACGLGGSCEVFINRGYPCLYNNDETASIVAASAAEFLGKENVEEAALWMAAEDFAYYTQHVDACFYLLGVALPEDQVARQLHTSTFDIDEKALTTGAGLMAYIAIRLLEKVSDS